MRWRCWRRSGPRRARRRSGVLDNEPLPIRICGLMNTVIHLGWGKYQQSRPQTTFVFEDCENVVLKDAAAIVHADEPKDPPPLYRTENSRRIRVRGIKTSWGQAPRRHGDRPQGSVHEYSRICTNSICIREIRVNSWAIRREQSVLYCRNKSWERFVARP